MQNNTVEDILENNPKIDRNLLEESSRMKEKLKQLGHKRPGYQLERRRAKVIDRT